MRIQGFEWVLLVAGAVLTLALVVIFLLVFARREKH